jgi:hypothetical protein
MTALTDTYIEEIANGRVPSFNSPERIGYEKEMMDGYDYTWATQNWMRIRNEVQSEVKAKIDIWDCVDAFGWAAPALMVLAVLFLGR